MSEPFDDYEIEIKFHKGINDEQFDVILFANQLDILGNYYDEIFHTMDNMIILGSEDVITVDGPFIFE